LQAQPEPLLQVRFLAMHESPHALPSLHTLQQLEPPESVGDVSQAVTSGAELASTSMAESGMAARRRRSIGGRLTPAAWREGRAE
jgi:hypothetical protein